MNMSMYRIILDTQYTFSDNWTLKRLYWHLKKECQVSSSLSLHWASIAFTSGDDKFDSALLMIKIIKTELRSAMGSWWLDDELHWTRNIQKS
jgi:hypothetical protein